jgi:hypothetical protein
MSTHADTYHLQSNKQSKSSTYRLDVCNMHPAQQLHGNGLELVVVVVGRGDVDANPCRPAAAATTAAARLAQFARLAGGGLRILLNTSIFDATAAAAGGARITGGIIATRNSNGDSRSSSISRRSSISDIIYHIGVCSYISINYTIIGNLYRFYYFSALCSSPVP